MHRCRNHNKIKFLIKSQQTRATNPTPFPDLPPDTTPGCFDVVFFIEYIILCKYVSFWKSLFKFNASRKGPIIYTPMGKGGGGGPVPKTLNWSIWSIFKILATTPENHASKDVTRT